MASVTKSEEITVFYNRENPGEVTLHPGQQRMAIIGMARGGTAAIVSGMFIFALASWLS
jgi:hypothetical protein